MNRNPQGLVYRSRILAPALICGLSLLAASARGAEDLPKVAVVVQDKTPPGFLGWNKASAGTLSSIEAALQTGLAAAGDCTVLTRSQFDTILAEQDLAYKTVVNNHARLGQLIGTDYIVVGQLISDIKNTDRKTISAYGISETQTSLSSQAQVAVSILHVPSGAVVAQQQFAESLPGSHEALTTVLQQAANWLATFLFRVSPSEGSLHQIRIAPTSRGRAIRGLDVLVDGSFQANTPATLDLESGVREITLKRGDKILWSNRLRVSRDFAVEPELGGESLP
jgi:hypothetical protein